MKKIILYITILLLAITNNVVGRTVESLPPLVTPPVATIETVAGTYGSMEVNVNLADFTTINSIGAITMNIGFDPTIATFTGITYSGIPSGITSNVVGNEIKLAWSNVPAQSVNGIGFKLKFNYTGGSCNLTFNQGCEISDALGSLIQTTFTNGAITQPSFSATATIATQAGDWSNVNELPIVFAGFPTPASAASFNISYNSNALQFIGTIPATTANASNGVISIAWSNTTAVDLNTTTFKLLFNYLGGVSNVNFTGFNEISNGSGSPIPVTYNNGGITQGPSSAIVDIDDAVVGVTSGATVVPVSFSGFPVNQGAVSMNIAYDNTKLNFVGTTGLTGLISSANNGVINLAWSNQNGANITGFNLLFSYIGGSSNLTFTGLNEITTASGGVIPVTFTNGSVVQPSTSIDITIDDVDLTPGNTTVSVPVLLSGITGNVNATTMYINFDNTKLTYTGVENLQKMGILANQDLSTNTIILNWSDAIPANTLTNGKFLDLKFNFIGGAGNYNVPVYFTTFNSNSGTLADAVGAPLMANWINGSVNYNAPITAFNVTGGGSYCAGGTGELVGLDGSQLGISYQLKVDGSNVGGLVPGDGNPINFGLQTAAGNYTVEASLGLSTLLMTGSVNVVINALPTLAATPTQILCNGGTGSVTLLASGGIPAYTYGGDATTGLIAGTYNYTVTDGNGCTATASATIDAAPAAIILTATPTQILCNGETGSVLLSCDGLSPFTYGGDAITGLTAGTYNYTVTDGNGCTAIASATIDAAPAAIILTATPTQILCNGETGSVLLSCDGLSPFTYGGDATTGLTAGTYNYTVTDGNGCTAIASATIDAEPALIIVTANTTATAVCLGGTVTLTGGGALNYAWDNGVTDGLAFAPATTTTYTVIGTDGNGCENTADVTVTVNLRPTASIAGDQAINNGSSALLTLTVTGTGTISGTLSDGTPFTGTAPTINVSVSPVVATSYTIATLTDDNCTALPGDLSGMASVTVLYKVSGILEYNNDPSPRIPLVGFTVNLKDGLVTIVSTTTDANGYYEFWTSNGTYSLDVITASGAFYYSDFDDVLALYDYIVTGNLIPEQNSLRLLACDVDLNNDINFDDVLALYDLVTTGTSPAFIAPEFIYETPSIIVNST